SMSGNCSSKNSKPKSISSDGGCSSSNSGGGSCIGLSGGGGGSQLSRGKSAEDIPPIPSEDLARPPGFGGQPSTLSPKLSGSGASTFGGQSSPNFSGAVS